MNTASVQQSSQSAARDSIDRATSGSANRTEIAAERLQASVVAAQREQHAQAAAQHQKVGRHLDARA